jgi:hypothetical protein
MPPHIIKDPPAKRKTTNSKNWHLWVKEQEHRNRVCGEDEVDRSKPSG